MFSQAEHLREVIPTDKPSNRKEERQKEGREEREGKERKTSRGSQPRVAKLGFEHRSNPRAHALFSARHGLMPRVPHTAEGECAS